MNLSVKLSNPILRRSKVMSEPVLSNLLCKYFTIIRSCMNLLLNFSLKPPKLTGHVWTCWLTFLDILVLSSHVWTCSWKFLKIFKLSSSNVWTCLLKFSLFMSCCYQVMCESVDEISLYTPQCVFVSPARLLSPSSFYHHCCFSWATSTLVSVIPHIFICPT